MACSLRTSPGVCVEQGDGVNVDEDGHRLTCMDGADAEVVHAVGAAAADFARRST
jgi:hypothetical protein